MGTSGARLPAFTAQLGHSPAGWGSSLTSLCLSFLTKKDINTYPHKAAVRMRGVYLKHLEQALHAVEAKGLQLLPILSFSKCCRSQGEGRQPQSHRSWAKPKTSSQPQTPLTTSFPGSLPSFTKQMLDVSRTEVRYNFSWSPTST